MFLKRVGKTEAPIVTFSAKRGFPDWTLAELRTSSAFSNSCEAGAEDLVPGLGSADRARDSGHWRRRAQQNCQWPWIATA